METITALRIIGACAIVVVVILLVWVHLSPPKHTITCKCCGEKFPDKPPYFVSDSGHFCCSDQCMAKTNQP